MINDNRRDVASRKAKVFPALAARLVKMGLTPNQISVASSVFATISAAAILRHADQLFTQMLLIVISILGIQLRLVCNLIDGLMAIEGGLKTPTGELFNEVPDRVSDSVIIIACGYAGQVFFAHAIELGWAAALFALGTAYIRTLGASMSGKNDFAGPTAKQHRMFIVSLACLGEFGELGGLIPVGSSFTSALALIALGSFVTCVNRLKRISIRMGSPGAGGN